MDDKGRTDDAGEELPDFVDFVRRIRTGDNQAAAELVQLYEPLIRREVRLHIRDRRLRRLFESSDVCQSVLGSFFAGTALGRFNFDTPEQLVRLLAGMARNKVAEAARLQYRGRRDTRRTTGLMGDAEELAGKDPSPSEIVGGRELLERLESDLTEDERAVANLRRQGRSWAEIAVSLGGTAGARRVQLSRAIIRVSRRFGLA